jgi:hypothetical protein
MRSGGTAFFVMLAAVAGCSRTADEDVPLFVDQLISEFEAGPEKNPPGSVWRYEFKGNVVFYVPPSCCDIPGELYDNGGNFICSPDGGITGDGNGKCPDFFSERTEAYLVWADNR